MTHKGTWGAVLVATIVSGCADARPAMSKPEVASMPTGAGASGGPSPDGMAAPRDQDALVDGPTDLPNTADANTADANNVATASTPFDVCDGSDQVRVHYAISRGFTPTNYAFTAPVGEQFFVVDGHCRYFASEGIVDGLFTGTLSDAQASALSVELSLSELASWKGSRGPQCPDYGGPSLSTGAAELSCGCPCEGDPRPGVPEAMQGALSWMRRLIAQGSAWDGPVRAVAQPLEEAYAPAAAPNWPLAIDLKELAPPTDHNWTAHSGVRLSGEDARQLRDLRAAGQHALGSGEVAAFAVRADDGTAYAVTVRDELPEDMQAAFRAFAGYSAYKW